MARFSINILGCGSATPSLRHNTSSQVVDFRDSLMMIDCGEGTQQQVRRFGLKFSRIRRIFISHLHGDHCLGLPGLLSTMALHGKGGEIEVYMPSHGIDLFKRIIAFFLHDKPYEIKFIGIEGNGGVLLDDDALSVTAFPLYHRIPCYGFIFKEKSKLRHLRGEMIRFYNIPVKDLHSLRQGLDWTSPQGTVIPNDWLTLPADPSYSYAYCSDTVMDDRVIEAVHGVDVLYHEATYDHSLEDRAMERGHSTARQAGYVAKMADVKLLVIGHYSKRYQDVSILIEDAAKEFERVIAANEGLTIDIPELLKE